MKSRSQIVEDLNFCLQSMSDSNCNSSAEENIKELIEFFSQLNLHIILAPDSLRQPSIVRKK